METRKPIVVLANEVVEELKKLNYAYNTICGMRASFRRICSFARDKGERYFSEELGKEYLKERYDCTIDYYLNPFPEKAKEATRSIRLLGDYQLHGVIIRRIVKRKGYVKPPQFEEVLTAYEKECEKNEYSLRGMRSRLQRLYFFVDYLSLRKIMDVADITPELISDYVKSISPRHEKSIAAILTTLRVFLRFQGSAMASGHFTFGQGERSSHSRFAACIRRKLLEKMGFGRKGSKRISAMKIYSEVKGTCG